MAVQRSYQPCQNSVYKHLETKTKKKMIENKNDSKNISFWFSANKLSCRFLACFSLPDGEKVLIFLAVCYIQLFTLSLSSFHIHTLIVYVTMFGIVALCCNLFGQTILPRKTAPRVILNICDTFSAQENIP